MAQTFRRPAVRNLPVVPGPETNAEPKVLWSPVLGMHTTVPLSRVPDNKAQLVHNLLLRDGSAITRSGFRLIGTVGNNILRVDKFVTDAGVGHLLRFRTSGIDRWNGSAWVSIPPGFVPSNATIIPAVTPFANAVYFSYSDGSGTTGIVKYDFTLGTVAPIPDSPKARHLTAFAGRILASDVVVAGQRYPGRIQWSVKGNANDWAGIGRGFEDLTATPGGSIDGVVAVVPVTDDQAIVVRTNSIWLMATTGNPDAPFAFGRITEGLGTSARFSVIAVPGGAALVGKRSVWVVQVNGGFDRIGSEIDTQLFDNANDQSAFISAFDSDQQELAVLTTEGGISRAYIYSFENKGWSRLLLQSGSNNIQWITYAHPGVNSLAIDDLVGTIDGLSGTIDGLVGSSSGDRSGMIFAERGTSGSVRYIAEGTTDDEIATGIFANAAWDLQSGVVQVVGPFYGTEVHEIALEYQSDSGTTVVIEWSRDGVFWDVFSTQVLVASSVRPKVVRAVGEAIGDHLMWRLRSDTLANFRLISFMLMPYASQEIGT